MSIILPERKKKTNNLIIPPRKTSSSTNLVIPPREVKPTLTAKEQRTEEVKSVLGDIKRQRQERDIMSGVLKGIEKTAPIVSGAIKGINIAIEKKNKETLEKYPYVPGPRRNLLSQTELHKMPEQSFWDKVKQDITSPFVKSEATQKAEAWDIWRTTELINEKLVKEGKQVSRNQVASNLKGYQKTYKIPREEIGLEPAMKVMRLPIAYAIATNPIAWGIRATEFIALTKLENKVAELLTGKKINQLSDILPDTANQTTRNIVDVLDIIGKGYAIKSINQKAPEVIDKFTKDVITKYNLPETAYLKPEEVKDIFQTGTLLSPEKQELFAKLGLSTDEIKIAFKEGVSIKIPTEKIVTITDSPFWAKIKSALNIAPFLNQTSSSAGSPSQVQTISGLLSGESGLPLTPMADISKPAIIPPPQATQAPPSPVCA